LIEDFEDIDRHKTVAWLSALVSIGLIDIGEFLSVMVCLDSAYVGNEDVSETFLVKLTDYYLVRQGLPI